jgi:hypothetical protein
MDIGARLRSDFPFPWDGLSLAITEESTPPQPSSCSLAILTSRHLRALFFTDRSAHPELCLGSPAEPWRWWHIDTIADAINVPSPIDHSLTPGAQIHLLIDFLIANDPTLTDLLSRRNYKYNREPLREIEKQQSIAAAQRLGVLMKPDDPRRKWYSLRTLGARQTA